jgi:hypothetical protein
MYFKEDNSLRLLSLTVIFIFTLIAISALPVVSFADVKAQEKKPPLDVHQPAPWSNIKAAKQLEPEIPDSYKDLEKAYSEYWKLYMTKDYKKLYEMESNSYRKENPFKKDVYDKYIPKNMKMTAVMALRVEKIEGKQASVFGNYYYSMGALKSIRRFKDKWVKEDSGWKHIPTEGQFLKRQ